MSIFPTAIALLVGAMVVMALVNVIIQIRDRRDGSKRPHDFYPPPYDATQQDPYLRFPAEDHASSHISHTGHDGGDWGGRDMSSDHHNLGGGGGHSGGHETGHGGGDH